VCLGGNSGASLPDPLTGLPGLARTAAREWPGVPVTAVSIETSSRDIEGVAARVLEVLAAAPGGVLAYRDETWWRVDVEPFGALPEPAAPDALAGPDGATVIWATGGLRGITATAALALARRCGNARAILIGRPVAPEPDWARGVADHPLVTAAVAALGAEATPQAVRTVVADIRRARAEAATLAAFSEAGIPARALHVNIVDRNAVARVIETLEPRLRQPDVLIHGAGARADRRLADKRADDFETVWRPKVDGLTALLDPSVLPDTPRRLLLFASTAGTFGNPGQADYAAANEVLVAAAESLRRQDEHCRATAIAWGPWAAGMVDAEGLARFKKRGVAVIEPDEGASLFADLAFADPGPVIIAGSDPAPAPTLGSVRFAPATEPVLTEHRLNGRPVLPAAWAAARLARLAGTLELVGFEVDAGLPLDTVAGAVVTVRREGARWRLEHGSTLAFVAEAVRSPTAQEPVAAPMPGLDEGRSLDPRGYLEGPLQYGPSFRRVEAAWRTAEGEVSLKLGPLPVLPGWQGAINPLLYDIATHGVLIHALERSSDSCLPRRVARIVWVRPVPTGVPLSVRTRFVLDTPKNIVADIDAFDADGMLLLRLEGFEALRRPASLTRGVMLREGERTSVPAGSAG
jgi:NADP-dependent 3-hydroxy acid dehydrogenase YdfG